MPDVLLELPIAATPEQVYAASTEQARWSSWWTEMSSLSGSLVRWAERQGAPSGAGTYVTWDLTPVDHGTMVRFGHREYGSVASVAFNWGWYLSYLKDYLETVQGQPGQLHA